MLRMLMLGALLSALLIASPAAADCLDEVERLDGRIDRLSDEKKSENDSTTPDESWFGAPASLDAAREHLENARALAEEGKEAGCQSHLDQVRSILSELTQ